MIREIKDVRQNRGEDRRRWFTDQYWDLYIWSDDRNRITGFQLCYDKTGREHAFNWFNGKGYSHTKVNFDREVSFRGESKMSSVLIRDGIFDKQAILAKFKTDSINLDQDVVRFVCAMITKYKPHRV
jgi:hypothetical protein